MRYKRWKNKRGRKMCQGSQGTYPGQQLQIDEKLQEEEKGWEHSRTIGSRDGKCKMYSITKDRKAMKK